MSEPVFKWATMRDIQKNALVAEKIMGWQWVPYTFYDAAPPDDQLWLLPDGQSVTRLTSGEWTYYLDEPEVYPENSPFPLPHKDNRHLPYWIPPYTTSMDEAWEVLQAMSARYNAQAEFVDEPFAQFVDELLPNSGGEIWTAWKCMATEVAKWTPESICIAALRACGQGIED